MLRPTKGGRLNYYLKKGRKRESETKKTNNNCKPNNQDSNPRAFCPHNLNFNIVLQLFFNIVYAKTLASRHKVKSSINISFYYYSYKAPVKIFMMSFLSRCTYHCQLTDCYKSLAFFLYHKHTMFNSVNGFCVCSQFCKKCFSSFRSSRDSDESSHCPLRGAPYVVPPRPTSWAAPFCHPRQWLSSLSHLFTFTVSVRECDHLSCSRLYPDKIGAQ